VQQVTTVELLAWIRSNRGAVHGSFLLAGACLFCAVATRAIQDSQNAIGLFLFGHSRRRFSPRLLLRLSALLLASAVVVRHHIFYVFPRPSAGLPARRFSPSRVFAHRAEMVAVRLRKRAG